MTATPITTYSWMDRKHRQKPKKPFLRKTNRRLLSSLLRGAQERRGERMSGFSGPLPSSGLARGEGGRMRKWVVGKERKGEKEKGGSSRGIFRKFTHLRGKRLFLPNETYFPHLLYQKCAENWTCFHSCVYFCHSFLYILRRNPSRCPWKKERKEAT